jgi:hypothetical protein
MTRRSLLFLPLLLAASLAQTTAPTPRTLTGAIVDETGRPVVNVTVTLRQETLNTATSAADGSFTLAFPGKYSPYGEYVAVSPDGSRQAWFHQPDLQPGETPAPRLVLKPARALHLKVDAAARAVQGATVVAGANHFTLARAATDAAGEATLLVPADAPLSHLAAFKSGVGLDYALVWAVGQAHTDPYHLDPAFTAPVHFTLNGAKSVTIHVRDDAHKPLAGATVEPWYFVKPRKGGMFNVGLDDFVRTTDASGDATFDFLPADNQEPVTFWYTKDQCAPAGRCLYNLAVAPRAITAMLLPLVPLSGRVTDVNGRTIAGATVRADGAGYQFDSFGDSATSAADGTFSLHVAPDMYYIFTAQKEHDIALIVAAVIRRKPPATPLQLTLDAGRRVHGQLTAGPANVPLPNVRLELTYRDESYEQVPDDHKLPAFDNRVLNAFFSQAATTDKQGNFEFYTVAGAHHLRAYAPPNDLQQELVVREDDTLVNLHGNLAPGAPTAFSGRVVLADAPESAVPEALLDSAITTPSNLAAPHGTAGADGSFTLRRLPVNLRLGARSPDGKFAAILLVTPTDDHLTLALAPAAIATGRLLSPDGQPLPGVELSCGLHVDLGQGLSTTAMPILATTDPAGNFTLSGLVPGERYHVDIIDAPDGKSLSTRRPLTNITPKKPGPLSVGDLTPR